MTVVENARLLQNMQMLMSMSWQEYDSAFRNRNISAVDSENRFICSEKLQQTLRTSSHNTAHMPYAFAENMGVKFNTLSPADWAKFVRGEIHDASSYVVLQRKTLRDPIFDICFSSPGKL